MDSIRPEPRYRQVRLVSNVDVRDPQMDRFGMDSVNLLEVARQHGGDRVLAEAAVERNPDPPGRMGRLWRRLTRAEPDWSGRRTYSIRPDSGSRVVSPGVEDAAPVGEFLGSRLAAHPEAMHVVHLVGHGRGYRQAAGMPFAQYRAALQAAVGQSGRPVDLLVLESCLGGNLEALAAIAPLARYALVSEETISASVTGKLIARSLRDLAGQPEIDARQLGETIVGNMSDFEDDFGRKPLSTATLALVDLRRLPALVQAVDELGRLLAEKVEREGKGPVADLLAVNGTFPAFHPEERLQLRFGDLKQIALAAQKTGPGPLAEAAAKVLGELTPGQTVVSLKTDPRYTAVGGISVQVPHASVSEFEASPKFSSAGYTRFEDSAAPEGWKLLSRGLTGSAKA